MSSPSTPRSSTSYLRAHYRGELPLWQSYWCNVLAVTLIVVELLSLINATLDSIENPTRAFFFFASLWVFIVALTWWQLVGLFRSASRAKRETGKIWWPTLARVVAFCGVVQMSIVCYTMAIPQMAGIYEWMAESRTPGLFSLRLLNRSTEIEISGNIVYGVTEALRDELDRNPNIKIVHLRSPGGRIGESRRLRSLFQERGLTTYVSSECHSACALAFLGGKDRVLHEAAKLGFHRPDFPGMNHELAHRELKKERALLHELRVTPAVTEKVLETPYSELYIDTPENLVAHHLATHVTDGLEFAYTELGSEVTQKDIEAGFLALPLYGILKKHRPEIYMKVIETYQRGIAAGLTKAEVLRSSRTHFGNVGSELLPYASDEVILAFGRLIELQLSELGSQGPDSCYGLLFPEKVPARDSSAELSPQTRARELALLGRVIESASVAPQKPPSPAEIRSDLQLVFSRLRAEYGEDAAVLAQLEATGVDRQKACMMAQAMYHEISLLPAGKGARILRALFASEQRPIQ